MHNGLIADSREHATTSVQVAALGKRNQSLGKRTQALGPGLGRLDRLVGEQGSSQVGEHEALVRRTATETGSLGWLRHYQ